MDVKITIMQVEVANLRPNPWNTNSVGAQNFEKLKGSIEKLGFFKPILARELDGGFFEILGGEHRWRAAMEQGISTVPVISVGKFNDLVAKQMSLVDNERYGEDDQVALQRLIEEIRALAVTLITYHDKRRAKDGSSIDTIREVIERWAPPNENDTAAYIREVAKAVGVTPDMVIDLHDYDTLRPLVEAIIRHENGRGPLKTLNSWYTSEVIEEGLRRAGVVKAVKAVKALPVTKETAGATVTAGIGLAQLAEVIPQISAAMDKAQGNITSGDTVRVIFGIATILVAGFIAWSQVCKYKKGIA